MNIGLGAFNLVLVRLASVAGPFAIAWFAARPEAMLNLRQSALGRQKK